MPCWRGAAAVSISTTSFGSVVAEVERYRSGRILVLDDDIRKLPITGNFDIRDTDAFLKAASVSCR